MSICYLIERITASYTVTSKIALRLIFSLKYIIQIVHKNIS